MKFVFFSREMNERKEKNSDVKLGVSFMIKVH